MAATNFTPIQLYHSTTASAAPVAGNLANGELAINITDGKLFYKDNGGTVQVLATKGTGTIGGSNTQVQYNSSGALAGSSNFTFNGTTATINTLNLTNALGTTYGGTGLNSYTTGDIVYASASNTLSKLTIGTNGYILTSNGSIPTWTAGSSISVNTADNLSGGAAGSVPYQSGPGATTFLSIGTANRVLTSSGTAPQWVTSLTGLTGVSSSGLTNTSLTSGRVVYSTTGGAQTDSASLTFNGTTLTAGGFATGGSSTLDKLVKIGDSAFNLPAVLSATAPAKLYVSTATVTDASSAGGATNTLGTITSFGSTTVAASNTGVTYTNLATLYIAGAPTAGTNVTITNPYALYVAAGDAYFGGTVTAGTVNLTTLDLTNLEVTNIKAKDGTASITLADSTGVASFTANPVLSGGTANGVAYLNGSKVLTTGSALTFDGTKLYTSGVYLQGDTTNYGGYSFQAGNQNGLAIRNAANSGLAAWFAAGNSVTLSGAGDYAVANGASGIIFGVATSEQMRLTSTGLGIGTSSPQTKLDVASTNTATDSIGNAFIKTTDTQAADVGGKLTLGGLYNASSYYAFGGIAGKKENSTSGNVAGYLQLLTTTSAGALTERARLDSSGNLGLGVTPSAWYSDRKVMQLGSGAALQGSGAVKSFSELTANIYANSSGNDIYIGTDYATKLRQYQGRFEWYTAPFGTAGNAISFTQAMTLTASSELLVGRTSASGLGKLNVEGGADFTGGNVYMCRDTGNLLVGTTTSSSRLTLDGTQTFREGSDTRVGTIKFASGAFQITTNAATEIAFSTNNSERARIDSSGNLLVQTTDSNLNSGVGHKFQPNATAPIIGTVGSDSSNSSLTYRLYSTGAAAYRFYVGYGGTVYATSTSISAISDATLKENVRDLETGLTEVMALRPRRFDWKNGDAQNVAGFVAQEVEQVLPELVTDYVYNKDEGGNDIIKKSLKMGDILPTLVKALQEQQAIINDLRARVAQLESN